MRSMLAVVLVLVTSVSFAQQVPGVTEPTGDRQGLQSLIRRTDQLSSQLAEGLANNQIMDLQLVIKNQQDIVNLLQQLMVRDLPHMGAHEVGQVLSDDLPTPLDPHVPIVSVPARAYDLGVEEYAPYSTDRNGYRLVIEPQTGVPVLAAFETITRRFGSVKVTEAVRIGRKLYPVGVHYGDVGSDPEPVQSQGGGGQQGGGSGSPQGINLNFGGGDSGGY